MYYNTKLSTVFEFNSNTGGTVFDFEALKRLIYLQT